MRQHRVGRFALLFALLVLCMGTQCPPEVLTDQIVSTSPSDGATAVSTDASITITFARAVDPASLDGGVSPDYDLANLDISFSADGTVMTATPMVEWSENTTYTVTISAVGFTDGSTLSSSYAFSFSTAGDDPPPPPDDWPPEIATGMDVMVAMPDDTRLVTDIYAPSGSGPWPVIFLRTPYDPGDSIHTERSAEYNTLGIVYVVQNSRGLFGSEGTADFFENDHQDGRDMITLLAAQAWCNGRIAMQGHSAPGNEWRTADDWPPYTPNPTTYYLRSGASLSETAPGSGETSDQYTYDPLDAAPTVGGHSLFLDQGPYDQVDVEARSDVLTYTTAALTSAVEVTGKVQAKIYLQCSQPDTDLVVRLSDVYPDGRSMAITEGVLGLRYRDPAGPAAGELLTAGDTYEIDLELWPTSIVFNSGHRIRIAVTSSSDPKFEPNPNTGDDFRAGTETQQATITVLHDQDHASAVTLPTP